MSLYFYFVRTEEIPTVSTASQFIVVTNPAETKYSPSLISLVPHQWQGTAAVTSSLTAALQSTLMQHCRSAPTLYKSNDNYWHNIKLNLIRTIQNFNLYEETCWLGNRAMMVVILLELFVSMPGPGMTPS